MLPHNKTKLLCTIGPASESQVTMQKMLLAGMNIARLNFSHGEFLWHEKIIKRLRAAAKETGRRLTIMADLPGPKMRIGQLEKEPVVLQVGDTFTLTSEEILGNEKRVSMSFSRLPAIVRKGEHLLLNDGIILLEVMDVEKKDVICKVITGGELRTHKGLNLPGIDLGISAFTDNDHKILTFVSEHGVDAVSQSFVERASDIETVRKAAAEIGYQPFIIAKIERAGALTRIDEIINAADGIMIARGDLGVETPLESIAIVQKELTHKANILGKPVITATQMLESMVDHFRPTRAEATDVANAILDGTDCVMLSEESAIGKFPVESVGMLAGIAAATEPHKAAFHRSDVNVKYYRESDPHLADLISHNVNNTVELLSPAAVVVPTLTGRTARMVSRFRLPVWIAAFSPEEPTCQKLQFSYGVVPVHIIDQPDDWSVAAQKWGRGEELNDGFMILTEGPSKGNQNANPRMEIIVYKRNNNR